METVVLDCGANTIKAGFAGDDTAKTIFPSVVGVGKVDKQMIAVGDAAMEKRGILSLSHPVENGLVQKWEDIEAVYEYVFEKKLEIDPSETPVLLCESSSELLYHQRQRQRHVEYFFEKARVPSLAVRNTAVLSLFATGREDGLVIESGLEQSFIVPIQAGVVHNPALMSVSYGGGSMSTLLLRLLEQKGFPFHTTYERTIIIDDIKRQLAYVALDFEGEYRAFPIRGEKKEYHLPDGTILDIGDASFRSLEANFNPSELGIQSYNIPYTCYTSVFKRCGDVDLRKTLIRNIVLSGGNCDCRGFRERFSKELSLLLGPQHPIKVAPALGIDGGLLPFVGGSIAASLSSMQSNIFVTKAEYQERGWIDK